MICLGHGLERLVFRDDPQSFEFLGQKMDHSGLRHYWFCIALVGCVGCASQSGHGQEAVASAQNASGIARNAVPKAMSVAEAGSHAGPNDVDDALGERSGHSRGTDALPALDPQCFSTLSKITDNRVIASSVEAVTLDNGQLLIAANDANGAAWVWHSADHGGFDGEMLAGAAQIACFERIGKDAQLGLIRRDASSGEFTLEIWQIGHHGRRIGDVWKANAHGFSPDLGAKCALLGNRHLVMSGIRIRKNKLPLHGLFEMNGKDVQLIENTSLHVPSIMRYEMLAENRGELLVRQVDKVGDKQVWPYVVYEMNHFKDSPSVITAVKKADFLFKSGSEWIEVSRDGCVVNKASRYCLPFDIQVTGVVNAYGSDKAALRMVWRTKTKSYLTGLDHSALKAWEMPENLQAFPVRQGEAWLTSERDAVRPDIIHGLRFVQFDPGCMTDGG